MKLRLAISLKCLESSDVMSLITSFFLNKESGLVVMIPIVLSDMSFAASEAISV
jgi:hypothetical protein